MGADFVEIVLCRKYFEQELICCLVKVLKWLSGEIGFEKQSKKEVLFHW